MDIEYSLQFLIMKEASCKRRGVCVEEVASCRRRGVVWKRRCRVEKRGRAEEEVSCVVEDVSCRGVMKKKKRSVKKRCRVE